MADKHHWTVADAGKTSTIALSSARYDPQLVLGIRRRQWRCNPGCKDAVDAERVVRFAKPINYGRSVQYEDAVCFKRTYFDVDIDRWTCTGGAQVLNLGFQVGDGLLEVEYSLDSWQTVFDVGGKCSGITLQSAVDCFCVCSAVVLFIAPKVACI